MRNINKKVILFLIVVCVFLAITGSVGAEELTGKEILERSRILDTVSDMEAEMEMNIIRGDRIRNRELIMFSLKGDDGSEMSLMRFTAPSDVQGSGFLTITHSDGQEENWIYLPALGRERRIISDERGGSFMGSDFTIEDISQTLTDYEHRLIEILQDADREIYLVESIPINEEIKGQVGFSRLLSYIDKEKGYLIKSETYADNGEMIKLLETGSIIEILEGVYLPGRLVMKDLETGGSTELIYGDIKINSGLSPDYFTRRQLSRPL